MSATATRTGLLLGLGAVILFGQTLTLTPIALEDMNPWFIAFGRGALAALLGGAILIWDRLRGGPRWPTRRQAVWLWITAGGVVFGFPVFTTLAMQTVPAAHAGVVLGVLPLLTALVAALIDGDRPSPGFWGYALAGAAVVAAFAVWDEGGGVAIGDVWLAAAAVTVSVGYTVGAKLSREIGGWRVICWVMVLTAPVTVPLTWWFAPTGPVSAPSWAALLYLGWVSQLLAFFLWYRGLALGGIARVSQVQLMQTFATLVGAVLFLGEAITLPTVAVAVLVAAIVWQGRRMPIARR